MLDQAMVGGNLFDREQVEAEVADSVQESVELSLVERFGNEIGLTTPRFNRYARECGIESCAKAPLDCDAVSPRLHRAPPGISLLYGQPALQGAELAQAAQQGAGEWQQWRDSLEALNKTA